jgi:hypothetical protein
MVGAMDLRNLKIVSDDLLSFMKCCYRFLNEEWPHANREPIPDQGFEEAFRATCVSKLKSWTISHIREMRLGEGLLTASGMSHEIDLVGLHDQISAIVELKHWESGSPAKNEVIVFFAKIFDFIAANPTLMLKDTCPIFVSLSGFEESGLAACLGLGIHPVGPALRPLPILIDSAKRMETEIGLNPDLLNDLRNEVIDLCSILHRICFSVEQTWLSNRCGFLSTNAIVVKAVSCVDSIALGNSLRKANAVCCNCWNSFGREGRNGTREHLQL